jgi:hypothetical protein
MAKKWRVNPNDLAWAQLDGWCAYVGVPEARKYLATTFSPSRSECLNRSKVVLAQLRRLHPEVSFMLKDFPIVRVALVEISTEPKLRIAKP